MTLAGLLDSRRVAVFQDCLLTKPPSACSVTEEINGVPFEASRVSVLWQIPQYILAGISEILVVVTAYQFAYLEAPDQHQHQCELSHFFKKFEKKTKFSVVTVTFLLNDVSDQVNGRNILLKFVAAK